MSATRRAPSVTMPGGANSAGTPERSRALPTHTDLKSLLAIDSGPIKSALDARKWLETKGWILTAEPYDHTKLINILVTAALSLKQADLKTVAIVVAFLLDANVMDHVSDTLVEAVATKTAKHLDNLVGKLSSSADFITASDTNRAEDTLTLKSTTATLEKLTDSLSSMVTKFMSAQPSPPMPQPGPRSWASVVKTHSAPHDPHRQQPLSWLTGIPPSTLTYTEQARVRQRIIQNARTILISIDREDDNTPKDFSTEGTACLCDCLNNVLTMLDAKTLLPAGLEEGEEVPPHLITRVIGMKTTKRGAYLLEFDSADSAQRFWEYADSNWTAFEDIFGYSMEVRPKAYALIAHFVPCLGQFNPSNRTSLEIIERENGLPRGAIMKAAWLKRPELRSSWQSVATLCLVCNNPVVANDMIWGRIFIGGKQITIQKDMKEPIRCNKCQRYGHTRHDCKDDKRCMRCMGTNHSAKDCSAPKPRCVACSPESTHNCADRACPTFKRLCVELDIRMPENRMPYFPTEDPESWMTAPPRHAGPSQVTEPPTQTGPTSEAPCPEHLGSPRSPCQTGLTLAGSSNSRAPSRLGNLSEFGFTTQPSHKRGGRDAPLTSK